MKYLKKLSYVILITILIASQVVIPDFTENVSASSLKTLKAELAVLKAKQQENKNKQAATAEEISKATREVNKISEEKEKIVQEIEKLNKEIEQLNLDINAKNEEIKDIISYYQLTATGEDAYLEYIFTATDFTDFIYRMAIAEQLSNYNTRLINEYNELITKNETKKNELSLKNIELNNKTKALEKKLIELSHELANTNESILSVDDEIESLKETISVYEKLYKSNGCNEAEDYDECFAKTPEGTLPEGTAFYRPVVKGYVSADWGWYRPFGYDMWHYGIDFAGTGYKAPVYSSGTGQVVAIVDAKALYASTKKNVCGGNKVYINHTINGKKYTTGYYHLATINVRVGDIVTYNTQVGTVGGTSAEYWDNCSTGAHVHLQVASGHFLGSSSFNASSFNPRNVLNAPSVGKSFSNRSQAF